MMNSKFIAKMNCKNPTRFAILVLLVFSITNSFACRNVEENTANTASPSPTAEKKTDDFEGSLASVRTGNFDFVFAFRRPDGDVFSSDDKKFLKANAPSDTNQWVLTGDGKCVIAGSNYKFMPEHLAALKKRFAVEDYSPKSVDADSNQNAAAAPPSAKSPISNTGNSRNTVKPK